MDNSTDILQRIKTIILERDPLAKIYLYGSRARGTMQPGADWDLLILLNNDKITNDLEKKITSPLYDLEFETGEIISPMLYPEKEWNSKHRVTPFFANVMKEGKLL